MALVVQTWGEIQKIPDFETVAGVLLFRNIFSVEPTAQHIFSFGREMPLGDEALFANKQFLVHARTVIRMVSTAVKLLSQGDMATLMTALRELGARHVSYNVEQQHYPIVGEALVKTLEMALGDAFTDEVRTEWVDVAGVIFSTMATTW